MPRAGRLPDRRRSASGYYAWRDRQRSEREREEAPLAERVRTIHEGSYGTYGAPRVHAELQEEGVRVGRKRVARLMRQARLQGVSRRRGATTTVRKVGAPTGPDLVGRDFAADGPDRLWVADTTYVPAGSGFLYLAVVLDAFSRRVVGWAMAGHLRSELVLAALDMAVGQRDGSGVVHHSDHGCQYTPLAFGARCREAGVRPSLGSVGACYDDAMCESFFATLECELLGRQRFATKAEARMAVFHFLEGWYNPRRRHSALSCVSPMEQERRHRAAVEPSSPQLSAVQG